MFAAVDLAALQFRLFPINKLFPRVRQFLRLLAYPTKDNNYHYVRTH